MARAGERDDLADAPGRGASRCARSPLVPGRARRCRASGARTIVFSAQRDFAPRADDRDLARRADLRAGARGNWSSRAHPWSSPIGDAAVDIRAEASVEPLHDSSYGREHPGPKGWIIEARRLRRLQVEVLEQPAVDLAPRSASTPSSGSRAVTAGSAGGYRRRPSPCSFCPSSGRIVRV